MTNLIRYAADMWPDVSVTNLKITSTMMLLVGCRDSPYEFLSCDNNSIVFAILRVEITTPSYSLFLELW